MSADPSERRRLALFGTGIVAVSVAASVTIMAMAGSPVRGIGGPASGAQSSPSQATAGVVEIELIDEQYAFGPDESLHLVYRLSGDLAAIGLEPTPPTPATTVPETTAPDTTVAPATTVAAVPGQDPTAIDPAAPVTTSSDTIPPTTIPPTTVPPPPPIPLTVEVTNYPPLTSTSNSTSDSTSDIDDLIGGDVDRDAFGSDAIDGVQVADARPSIAVADDGTATLTLVVPTDVGNNSVEERLRFDTPGLYPIRTELLATGLGGEMTVATHGTVVQRLPGADDPPTIAPPINLTVVTGAAPAGADATTADEPARALAFADAVELAGSIASPVTLQFPPPIVVAAAGTPEAGERLESALVDDEFVATPLMPLDVSAAAAAGKTEEFARQLGLGEDALSNAVPTTPSSRNPWMATEPLSGAGAQELRDLGFRYLVMPEQLYVDTVDPELPATDLFVEAALPGGGTLPLIVVDPLSEQLTPEAADDILESQTTMEWAVRTVTAMLVEQADDEPRLERSRVLSTPDLRAPDARLLLGLEALLDTTPSAGFTPASTLTGRTDVQERGGEPVRVELPAEAGPSLVARIALLDSTALSAASAGTMLPPDDPRPDVWADELQALISTSVSDDEAAATTARIQSEADAIRGSVVSPDPFSFTLTGRSGDIELQLANTSPDVLTVILRASSQKLSFPESNEPVVGPPDANAGDHTIELRPNDENSVIIPVRAKSNGTSPITVQILTPAGEVIGDPVTITATVTAFTGLGQVLTGGLVLVLLTWWATHWRSRRRAAVTEVRDRHPSGGQ